VASFIDGRPRTTSPSPVLPDDGAAGQPLQTVLCWTPVPGVPTYRLQVATEPSFATPVLDRPAIDDVRWTISGLTPGTTYLWRIGATDSSGATVYSAVRSFRTGAAPGATALSSPVDGAVGQPTTVTVRWQATLDAASYHLQVANDSSFTSVILNDTSVVDTFRTVGGLNAAAVHHWRVRARNASGIGAWSPSWRFTTAGQAPLVSYLYQESALVPPWRDVRSWSVTRTYTSTSPVFEGATAARFVHSPWAALQFSQGTWGAFASIDPSLYSSLDFAVHGGASGVTLKVSCLSPAGAHLLAPVTVTVPANTWQQKSVPMAQLAASPFISVYFTAGGATATFSMDNIGLTLRSASGPAAASVPLVSVPADMNRDGLVDAVDLAAFASSWRRKDIPAADIGPADGILDDRDVESFRRHWSNDLVRRGSGPFTASAPAAGTVLLDRSSSVTSFERQRFTLRVPSSPDVTAVEWTVSVDPQRTRIDAIAPSAGNMFLFRSLDAGTGTAVMAAAEGEGESLDDGAAVLTLSLLGTVDDTVRITVRTVSGDGGAAQTYRTETSLRRLFVPDAFRLMQNFPNPFNPSTVIRYAVPERSRVDIEIFNALGQRVARVDGGTVEAGFGETRWTAAAGSGVLFCRVTATAADDPSRRWSAVQKMVLMK